MYTACPPIDTTVQWPLLVKEKENFADLYYKNIYNNSYSFIHKILSIIDVLSIDVNDWKFDE